MKTNCHKCVNKRNVPGDAHIACAKPDPNMTGNPIGIRMGWFFYPICFDPNWMTKECCNMESIGEKE
jgi:hypothetical protein